MKKLILLTAMLFCGLVCLQAQTVTRNGNNFTQVKSVNHTTHVIKTDYTYTLQDKTYPIYINKNSGRC